MQGRSELRNLSQYVASDRSWYHVLEGGRDGVSVVLGGAEEHSLLLSESMSDSSLIVVKSVTDVHLVGAGCVGTVLDALAGGTL
jgi:hypothetical protein